MTDEGAAALAAQRTEWRRFARGMQAVLGTSACGVQGPMGSRRPWGGRHDPDEAPRDLVEEYLDEMRRGLRALPGEAEVILAEAEDHLRETAAAGSPSG